MLRIVSRGYPNDSRGYLRAYYYTTVRSQRLGSVGGVKTGQERTMGLQRKGELVTKDILIIR